VGLVMPLMAAYYYLRWPARLALVGALCFHAGRALGGDVKIAGADAPGPFYAELSVPAAEGDKVEWKVFPLPGQMTRDGRKLYLGASPGVKYTVYVDVINFKAEKWDTGQAEVSFGGKPTPPPPKPDDPPKPPDPKPPGPVPLPGPGLKVLLVQETGQVVTAAQISVAHGYETREWLAKNAKEFRLLDQHADLSAMPPMWADAMKRARTQTPWVVASNGTDFVEAPVRPDMTPAQFIDLLKPLVK
jgi:hypothetical protein